MPRARRWAAILEKARALTSGVTEAAHDEFDARSERWQESNTGIKVRNWIERWEVTLDDVDLEVPEPLTEVDPEILDLRSVGDRKVRGHANQELVQRQALRTKRDKLGIFQPGEVA